MNLCAAQKHLSYPINLKKLPMWMTEGFIGVSCLFTIAFILSTLLAIGSAIVYGMARKGISQYKKKPELAYGDVIDLDEALIELKLLRYVHPPHIQLKRLTNEIILIKCRC